MKICFTCRKPKNNSGFYQLTSSPDGLQSSCIMCEREHNKRGANVIEKSLAKVEVKTGTVRILGSDVKYKCRAKGKYTHMEFLDAVQGT